MKTIKLTNYSLTFLKWKEAVRLCFEQGISETIIKQKGGTSHQVILIEIQIDKMFWGN